MIMRMDSWAMALLFACFVAAAPAPKQPSEKRRESTPEILGLEQELKKASGENKKYFSDPNVKPMPQVDGLDQDNEQLLNSVKSDPDPDPDQAPNTQEGPPPAGDQNPGPATADSQPQPSEIGNPELQQQQEQQQQQQQQQQEQQEQQQQLSKGPLADSKSDIGTVLGTLEQHPEDMDRMLQEYFGNTDRRELAEFLNYYYDTADQAPYDVADTYDGNAGDVMSRGYTSDDQERGFYNSKPHDLMANPGYLMQQSYGSSSYHQRPSNQYQRRRRVVMNGGSLTPGQHAGM